jgi:hypothetical protein
VAEGPRRQVRRLEPAQELGRRAQARAAHDPPARRGPAVRPATTHSAGR